jgi:hypothetical protein
MSAQPLPSPVSPPASPRPIVRVEYVGFQNVAEHREFRFRLRGLDGSSEIRMRIALAAFGTGRLRLQDGPDVCYQKLSRTLAADTGSPEVITIDEVDLVGYAEGHPSRPKHRSWSSAEPGAAAPARPVAARASAVPAAPERPLAGGQRVRHAVFGLGVMSSPSGGHTVVRFEDGLRRFVTSMLEVDVLSAPQAWETGPRGKNRPCAGAA